MSSDFWNEFDKMTREAEGGGGAICHVTIMAGFKVYGGGLSPQEAFVPAPEGKDVRPAKAKGRKLCKQTGADFPKWGIAIIADKDKYYVRGKPRVYDNDRIFFRTLYNERRENGKYAVLLPALERLDIKVAPPWKGWIRLGFPSDPWAVEQGESAMKEGLDGTMRYPAVEVPTEVFEDEQAAMEAVSEMPTGGGDDELPVVPAGYEDDDWRFTVDKYIKSNVISGLGQGAEVRDRTIATQSKEFGVDSSYIEAIVDDVLPELVTAAAKGKLDKGLPEAAVIASLSQDFVVDAEYVKKIVDDIVPV